MRSIADTIRVTRLTRRLKTAGGGRTAPLLRAVYFVISLLILSFPVLAQEQGGGEADVKLPNLNSATFLGGISGGNLLMIGLVVSALGLVFGLMIYVRLRTMPVHSSMLEVSELIYE